MYELVHRYAPETPAGRTAVAVLLSLLGVPSLVLGLIGLGGNIGRGLVFLALGVLLTVTAAQLTWGVIRQASAAPEANPATERETEKVDGDPIERLRQRYAAGELTDEEFDQRLDRLVETEERERVHGEYGGRHATRERNPTPEYSS